MEEYKPGRPRTPIEHGTVAGYFKHRRYGPPPCEQCKKAWARRVRETKARRQ